MAKPDKKLPKAEAKLAKVDTGTLPVAGSRTAALGHAVEQMDAARLWYGEPVVQGDHTVIPVARVRAALGFGWGGGRSDAGDGDGGGGGGRVRAVPVGFIEVGPEGSSFIAITDPVARARTVAVAAVAAIGVAGAATVTVAGTLAGVRVLRAGRRTRPVWRRGR